MIREARQNLENLSRSLGYLASVQAATDEELMLYCAKNYNISTKIINEKKRNHENSGVIRIWTDGGCKAGVGGWAWVMKYKHKRKECSGGATQTTNNRMELQAAIEALRATSSKPEIPIIMFCDSKYVISGITEWIHIWLRTNWIGKSKKPVKNKELWITLYNLTKDRNITWNWVRGHSGNPNNERADKLATSQINKIRTS